MPIAMPKTLRVYRVGDGSVECAGVRNMAAARCAEHVGLTKRRAPLELSWKVIGCARTSCATPTTLHDVPTVTSAHGTNTIHGLGKTLNLLMCIDRYDIAKIFTCKVNISSRGIRVNGFANRAIAVQLQGIRNLCVNPTQVLRSRYNNANHLSKDIYLQ